MISFGLTRVSAPGRQTRLRVAAARSVVAFGTSIALFPATHNALVSVGRSLIYKFRRFYNIGRPKEAHESLRTNYRALEGHNPKVYSVHCTVLERVRGMTRSQSIDLGTTLYLVLAL